MKKGMAVRVSLLMALLISVLISWSASQEMSNISVNDNGKDDFSCLKGNGSCKSLQYVLHKCANVTQLGANILVNVSSNQSISGSLLYNFTSSVNITVVGADRPFILCEPNSSISITADEYFQVEWAWVGLVFYGCGHLVTSQPNIPAGLYHAKLRSVTIHDCSLIMLSQLELTSIHQVTISNSQFTQAIANVCSAILINNGLKGDRFLFTSNIITNYSCNSVPYIFLRLITVNRYDNFIFANNVVSNISNSRANGIIVLWIRLGTAILRNNSFANIRHCSSVVLFDSSVSDGLKPTKIEQNHFNFIIGGTIEDNILSYDAMGWDSFYMKGNQFAVNMNIGLISMQIDGNVTINSVPNVFVIDELVLINNIFTDNIPIFISSQSICIQHVYAKQNYLNYKSHQATIFEVGRLGFNFANGNLTMSNMTFIGNIINPITDSSAIVAVATFGVASATISNVTFKNNIGTPINFHHRNRELLNLTVSGIFLFVRNTGINGGACSFYQVSIHKQGTVNMTFVDNFAVYGGALYIAESIIEFDSSVVLQFQNNKAQTAGDSIYFATTNSYYVYMLSNWFKNFSELSSTATKLAFLANEENNGHISFFPGQGISLNFSITDIFNHPSSCSAAVYLFCNGTVSNCFDANIFLEGPSTVVISQESDMEMTTVDTNLILSSPETTNVQVKFACIGNQDTATQVHLNMTKCPLGFTYSSSRSVCECVQVVDKSKFLCSTKYGVACVSYRYWYGPISIGDSATTVYTIASCTFPECSSTYTSCPTQLLNKDGSSEEFVLLTHDPDDQCSTGRGGVLCSSCRFGLVFTFTAVNCVAFTECHVWQPYIVILISLVFQMVFAVVLVLIVRFKISLGSGYLYGPMLFLSVISYLPLAYYPQYSFLNTIMSVLSSIPLLNLEVFGLIPWCFHPLDKVYNYSLRYLGPLTVLVVILVIMFVARQCPNALRRLQASPVHVICLLMILSFWSLADTSVNILTPKIITYSQNSPIYVVLLQPDMGYFSLRHLPVAIPALLVLVVLITPLLVLLLFFPLLSKVISLHRIKPFLDDFQACYKDRFRWYAAVYFIVWLINVLMRRFSVPTSIIQTLFMVLLASQVFFQPYADKLMNNIDAFLLLVMNFLIALVQSDSVSTAPASVVLIHILVIGPILCIIVWFGCVCITKCGVRDYFCNKCIKVRRPPIMTDIDHSIHVSAPIQRKLRYIEEDGEREPLIRIVDYH